MWAPAPVRPCSKTDRRPVLSQVAQVMLAKYGSLLKSKSGAVRLVRAGIAPSSTFRSGLVRLRALRFRLHGFWGVFVKRLAWQRNHAPSPASRQIAKHFAGRA